MPTLDMKALSERDICSKFITPALVLAMVQGIARDCRARDVAGTEVHIMATKHTRAEEEFEQRV